MMAGEFRLFRDGAAQALGALVAATTTGAVVLSNTAGGGHAGRIAVAGVLLFVLALGVGSAQIVGGSSFLVLGSALLASATGDQTAWVQSIVVGCGWYVAVELAWDSIERRTPVKRTPAVDLRRVQEVSTVVLISLVVTASAYLASTLGPDRTPSRKALLISAVLVALGFTARHLASTAPPEPDHV